MSTPTPTRQLLEARLGKDLRHVVAAYRADGLSWGRIAIQLHDSTDVLVTGETLRLWFGDIPAQRRSQKAGA